MNSDPNQEQESQQLREDLVVLSKLSFDSVKILGKRYEQHTGSISVNALASESFSERATTEAVQRLILGLIPDSLNHVIGMVSFWRQSDDRAKELTTRCRDLVVRPM